jgi:hypothetical protein
MPKKAKKTDWKFERSHAETLPLHIVMDMCSPGRHMPAGSRQYLWSLKFHETGECLVGDDYQAVNRFVLSAKAWAKENGPELESILMGRSTSAPVVWAAKNGRLAKEKEFMELCRQTEKGRKHWIQYCHKFTIIPENQGEILLEVAFGDHSSKGKEYLKKMQKTKSRCLSFVRMLMESEGIGPGEPIEKLLERLES